MKLDSYAGQAVMITGAASGFGALLASELAAMGARLALGDLNGDALERVAAPLRAAGADVIAQRCDVRVETEVAALVQEAVARFGRLDVGINNAGIAPPMKALIDTDEADLDLNFAVNTKGVFFGMKHQIRQMLAQREGVILNVASMAGLGGAPKLAAYAASKHAVVGLTKTAALEYARHGIRVNAVCPFYSTTPMVTDSEIGERQDFLAQGSPMKRLGRPDEIVATMLMLCAKDNSYLTGQAVAVDGGVSAF
ncbi:glucose 1-dehydrogenase [Burkholderia cenocepacia]|uniref:SDR family NAD(P)-dependent oxidoreductase n=1 Tax=Burkholderia cepacia complex TaxID=87882 RepID=UPI000F5781CC|nr:MULTISPECIES: glucose 1-dehydrogenase [Burkholderia cepacia complex]ELW9445392.1 glucose 1-dehydrogenase [Burkholderia cenocepacia]MBR8483813.1 glucose 1-dehydrogenase [Burkholderia cenocepacia]MDN7472244.1 glucose 1-dehydrogenase [Burkholderia orbicola]MDN7506419.1 glucose 1-dehydrogenase [Burkholderia orbicola]RQU23588.1 SDR family NAD(P)-dependent oxidoreductase [Burkholderia cenocepacia]